jgi:S1-C subfamily serine protease
VKSFSRFGAGTFAGLVLGLALVLGYAGFQGVAQALSVIAPPAAYQGTAAAPAAVAGKSTASSPAAVTSLTDLEQSVSGAYERVAPAVVYIISEGAIQSTPFGDFPETGAGSGVVIDDQGHILTNNHVVSGANKLEVTFSDGTIATATLVGRDPGNDLAVIKVDVPKDKLTVAPLGDSDALKPGQLAIAIGSPFRLEGTVTVGFVSSTGRYRATGSRPMKNMIQTDAAINPGNSGGPLLNSRGEVVGINTSIESPVSGSVGVGFAIPINTAKAALKQMEAGETIQHAWLGISGMALTPATAKELGVSVESGVYVSVVTPSSPADAAGLKGTQTSRSGQTRTVTGPGDVILEIDGRKVSKVDDISTYLDTKAVGDTVTLTIVRDGKQQTLQVKLAPWPETLSPTG